VFILALRYKDNKHLSLCRSIKSQDEFSAFFVHQPLTLPQKIDSREGLFRCPKGVVVRAGKMNFYLNQPPLTPVFGLFAAKYSAFWC